MSFIGKLGYSLIVALIGLLIVFIGLGILIGCIYALSAVMGKMRAQGRAGKGQCSRARPRGGARARGRGRR